MPDHDLKIFDVNIVEDPFEALDKELASFTPEITGISLRKIKVARPGGYHSCFEPHRKLIVFAKQRAGNAPIVVGGTAFSLYAPRIMQLIPEDYGILREG